MIVAALLKLVAAERLIDAAVLAVPLKVTVSEPERACSCARVMPDREPDCNQAARLASTYGAKSRVPGLIVELSKPKK